MTAGYKPGTNTEDVAVIAGMYAEGKSAEEISKTLRIELACIAQHEPKKLAKTQKAVDEQATAKKARRKKAQEKLDDEASQYG